jgi:hypothetical protein
MSVQPGTWSLNSSPPMEPLILMQLLHGFTSSLGGLKVVVAVREGGVVWQQYADLAAEMARWPAGACAVGGRGGLVHGLRQHMPLVAGHCRQGIAPGGDDAGGFGGQKGREKGWLGGLA